MTSNPETAGVEPVAWLYCNEDGLSPVKEVVSFVRWTADNRMGWHETALGPIRPPAAREDGEAVRKEQCPHCGSPRTLIENVDEHLAALATTRPAPETSVQKLHESPPRPGSCKLRGGG